MAPLELAKFLVSFGYCLTAVQLPRLIVREPSDLSGLDSESPLGFHADFPHELLFRMVYALTYIVHLLYVCLKIISMIPV